MVIHLSPTKSLIRLSPDLALQKTSGFNISEIFRISKNVFIFDLRNKTYINYLNLTNMKSIIKKISILVLAVTLIIPVAALAQKEEKEKDSKEKKELEQIIISLKGDNKEKVVVEVNGDNVTVNGKPLSEYKSGDISVNRHKIKDRMAIATAPFGSNWNFNDNQDFQFFSGDENRAMLGVSTEKSDKGAAIQEITEESAAEKAGLKKGDIISKVGDTKIADPEELATAIKKQKPGEKVTITFLRDDKEKQVTAELTKWKGMGVYSFTPGQNFKMEMPDMDLKLDGLKDRMNGLNDRIMTIPRTDMNRAFGQMMDGRPKLGLSVQDTEDGKGVKVIEVDDEGNAKKAGIKMNDIINEVDGKTVNSADDVAKIVRESKDKISIMVKLQRDGKTQNIEVKIPRKLKTADL